MWRIGDDDNFIFSQLIVRSIRFDNYAMRCGQRRLIASEECLALIGPAIGQVSTVTNMSTPLQADLSSVVEKCAISSIVVNFWVNQQLQRKGEWAGNMNCKLTSFMNKRGQARNMKKNGGNLYKDAECWGMRKKIKQLRWTLVVSNFNAFSNFLFPSCGRKRCVNRKFKLCRCIPYWKRYFKDYSNYFQYLLDINVGTVWCVALFKQKQKRLNKMHWIWG